MKRFLVKGLTGSFFIFLISLSFQSCVLTNSQVKLTKRYYSNLNDIDAYCNTLKEVSSQIEYERKLLYPETYTNDSIMVEELEAIYNTYSDEISHSDSTIQRINVLGNYFHDFSVFLPKQKATTQGYDRRVLSAIENFSSYLPFGIGLTVYKTLYDIVSYTTRFFKIPHTRKKMKEYISRGEFLVPENVLSIKQDFVAISKKLDAEKVLIKENYRKLLNDQKTEKESMDYYQKYNPIFLEKYHLVSSCKDLSEDIILFLSNLAVTHRLLVDETRKRKKIKSDLPGMNEFYSSLANTRKHFSTVSEARTKNKNR